MNGTGAEPEPELDSIRQLRPLLLGLVRPVVVVVALVGATPFLDHVCETTGICRRVAVKLIERRLTATAPARLERYVWFVRPIPEKAYHGGERLMVWPELVMAYEAGDGRTRWLRVRGRPDNSDLIQTYMAHSAGIFGLPWIDYDLPAPVVHRLHYDARRPAGWDNQPPLSLPAAEAARADDTYDTWLVASATNDAVAQLALMWAAPAPALSVRYDPANPEHVWPEPLLAALSRPLSRDIETWAMDAVMLFVGSAIVLRASLFAFRPWTGIAVALWLVALAAAPLWTPPVESAADMVGLHLRFPDSDKPKRFDVETVSQPGPNGAVRWSLAPAEEATLLARLAPPSPRLGWSDLLSRDEKAHWLGGAPGSGVAERYAVSLRAALLVLPDDQLRDLLDGLCESSRGDELVSMLRPALERLAAAPERGSAVRERAGDLAGHRAFCR